MCRAMYVYRTGVSKISFGFQRARVAHSLNVMFFKVSKYFLNDMIDQCIFQIYTSVVAGSDKYHLDVFQLKMRRRHAYSEIL